ncbi:autotransporter domain-containing protein [Herbaspirillum frisingense]|uniref:autotransporter family protein n=1 Tax=Herbaspirillum frisingense TaxID=92645 RepID=UPI0016023802|nr:autotransporter outer membrane beta-barrel domain-containing protein [Herbaspirillum frisingense]QNB07542.1 autotransporter domain-containing protein [Herbaspirillum frisingense]
MANHEESGLRIAGKALFFVASVFSPSLACSQSIIVSGSVAQVPDNNSSHNTIAPGNQGAFWSISDNLVIGDTAAGTVTVQDAAFLNVGHIVGLAANGTLNLDKGGVVQTLALLSADASSSVNFNGGVFRVNSSQPTIMPYFGTATVHINSGGAYIDSQGFTIGIDNSAAILTGTGTLIKQGSGTLNITGSNTWSGSTTISAGVLGFTNYHQSSSQVLSIGAASNTNYGKLNVTGAATFNPGANLAVDVASANTLAKGQTLRSVITAGSLDATTFNVTDNSALLKFIAVRNGNSIDLDIMSASNILDATQAQSMRHAYAAARVLDSWADSGDPGTVISAFNRLPDQASLARAVNQTLPGNASGQATMNALRSINRIMTGRFANTGSGISTGEETGSRQVWMKPFGSYASQNDENNIAGFRSNTYGLAAGIENEVGRDGNTRLGLSYAYASTRVNENTSLSGTDRNTRIDSNVLTVYANKALQEKLVLNLLFDVGWNENRSSRTINFGGLDRTAAGHYGALSLHTGAGLTRTVSIDNANTFFPTVRADYTRLTTRSYTETGADALNLNVDRKTTEAFVIGADGVLRHALSAGSHLEVSTGVGYDIVNDRGDLVAAYAGTPGQSFVTTGPDHGPWLFKAGLSYSYKFTQAADISLRYDAEGRSGFLNQAASLKAVWRF